MRQPNPRQPAATLQRFSTVFPLGLQFATLDLKKVRNILFPSSPVFPKISGCACGELPSGRAKDESVGTLRWPRMPRCCFAPETVEQRLHHGGTKRGELESEGVQEGAVNKGGYAGARRGVLLQECGGPCIFVVGFLVGKATHCLCDGGLGGRSCEKHAVSVDVTDAPARSRCSTERGLAASL